MTERGQLFKCLVCGIIAEVLEGGAGELVCCGQRMERLRENSSGATREQHVPVLQRTDGGVKVQVGSAPHPMESQHFVQWIEVSSEDRTCRSFLQPGQAPEATFNMKGRRLTARQYCCRHGLWKG